MEIGLKATISGLAAAVLMTAASAAQERSVFDGWWAPEAPCGDGVQCWIEINETADGHTFEMVVADRFNAQDRKCEITGTLGTMRWEHDYNIAGKTDRGDVQVSWGGRGDIRVQTTGWKCDSYEMPSMWYAFGDI